VCCLSIDSETVSWARQEEVESGERERAGESVMLRELGLTDCSSMMPPLAPSPCGTPPQTGDRILIFKPQWLALVLSGRKTLEVRGVAYKSGSYYLGHATCCVCACVCVCVCAPDLSRVFVLSALSCHQFCRVACQAREGSSTLRPTWGERYGLRTYAISDGIRTSTECLPPAVCRTRRRT
jgi:hypothetical protein